MLFWLFIFFLFALFESYLISCLLFLFLLLFLGPLKEFSSNSLFKFKLNFLNLVFVNFSLFFLLVLANSNILPSFKFSQLNSILLFLIWKIFFESFNSSLLSYPFDNKILFIFIKLFPWKFSILVFALFVLLILLLS